MVRDSNSEAGYVVNLVKPAGFEDVCKKPQLLEAHTCQGVFSYLLSQAGI